MAEVLLLRFAEEELIYLQRALHITAFPGFEAPSFTKLGEDYQALALAVADRTLRARSVVRWDGATEREVDPVAAGLLRDHARPHYSLFFDIMRKERPDQRFLYTCSKTGTIEYSIAEPGIHQFIGFPTRQAFVKRLSALLDLQEVPESLGRSGWISKERWAAALEIAPGNAGQALYIVSTQLPEEIARSFATALYSPSLIYHLALWKGKPDDTTKPRPEMALTILQGKSDLFLVWQPERDAIQLEIIPASIKHAWEYVKKILLPALEMLPSAKASAA